MLIQSSLNDRVNPLYFKRIFFDYTILLKIYLFYFLEREREGGGRGEEGERKNL